MTISERIKFVRGSMSRREFGETLGLGAPVIQNIEEADKRLKKGIPDNILKLIASTYKVRYEWLKFGDGDPYIKESQSEFADRLIQEHAANESEIAKAIIRAFVDMPDDEWVKLKTIIETIKEAKSPRS